MRRSLTALVLAGTLATTTMVTPTSVHAYWRGWVWGLGGLALGLTIAALARPAYAYYPAYSYGYGPAYGYASSGYGYGPYATRVMATAILPTATRATAIRGMVMAAATTGQPIAPSTMAAIGQPIAPPIMAVIGQPIVRGLRRLSGRPRRCDPPRSLALSRLSGRK